MFFLKKNNCIGSWFILLAVINAFFINTTAAQCRYSPKTKQTQTRSQMLVGGYGVSETLSVKARKSDDTISLDLHFETTEAAFSIQKDATLTLLLVNGETVVLRAYEMLHSDAYMTCCDKVWLMEVAYLIPKEDYTLLAENSISKIHLELDNRLKAFDLKPKKRGKISRLIRCFVSSQ